MKRILIIHGWGNNGNQYWIPWLKKQLMMKGFDVVNPDFPNPMYPKLDAWTQRARESIPFFNDDVSIVAYSSGVVFTLQLLSSFKEGEKIDKFVGIAPFDISLSVGAEETKDLYKKPFSYPLICQKANSFSLICSDNDPYIPLSIPYAMQKKLNADLQIVKNGGLLNAKSGYIHPFEVLNRFTRAHSN